MLKPYAVGHIWVEAAKGPVISASSTSKASPPGMEDEEDQLSWHSVLMVSQRWWQVHDFQRVTVHILVTDNFR